jgi:hypothetical protein
VLFTASIGGPLVRAGEGEREGGGVDDLDDLEGVEVPIFPDTEAAVCVSFGFVHSDPARVTLYCQNQVASFPNGASGRRRAVLRLYGFPYLEMGNVIILRVARPQCSIEGVPRRLA